MTTQTTPSSRTAAEDAFAALVADTKQRSKYGHLRSLHDLVENALAQGVRTEAVLRTLAGLGLDLSPRLFRAYLSRLRRDAATPRAVRARGKTPTRSASEPTAPEPPGRTSAVAAPARPATVESVVTVLPDSGVQVGRSYVPDPHGLEDAARRHRERRRLDRPR